MLADDREQAFSCNLAHLRTEIDGGIHHGEEGRDGPQERRPERGADRGVSSDRRRIVVGGPGNQSEAEGAKSPAGQGFRDPGAKTLFVLRIFLTPLNRWDRFSGHGQKGCILEASGLSPVAVSCC
jgi:hypothetical protein